MWGGVLTEDHVLKLPERSDMQSGLRATDVNASVHALPVCAPHFVSKQALDEWDRNAERAPFFLSQYLCASASISPL